MKHNLSGLPASSSSPENTIAFLLGKDFNLDAESPLTSNNSSVFGNYSVVLSYSGSRWYGKIMPPSAMNVFYNHQMLSEYHAFWREAFSRNNTLIISDVTTDGSPRRSDFFEMRKQNIKGEHTGYGPYGIQVPLVDLEGSGLFSCVV